MKMSKYSLILIGDSFVGKSSLLQRYKTGEYQEDSLSASIGVDWYAREVNGCQLTIYDTSGQERFISITRNYYRKANGVILVFDVTNRKSFNKILDWRDEVLEHVNENPIFLLIGNKCDEAERNIKQQEAQEMAESYSMEYIETSAKDGTNVEEIFEMITRMICEGGEKAINLDRSENVMATLPVNSNPHNKRKLCC